MAILDKKQQSVEHLRLEPPQRVAGSQFPAKWIELIVADAVRH